MTEREEGSGPTWRQKGEFNPQVTFESSTLATHYQERGMTVCVFRTNSPSPGHNLAKNTSASTLKPSGGGLWINLTLSRRRFGSCFYCQPHGPGEKCRPICVGMTWRRLIAAGTMREGRPRMEELNLEARQYGVGVSEGVEHVALRARIHHEAGN